MKKMSKIFSQLLLKGKYIFFISLIEKLTFFIVYLIIARYYSKYEFGLVTTIFAFANIVSSLLDFGFTIYFQRESAINGIELSKKFLSALNIRLLAVVIFIVFCIGYFYKEMHIEPLSIILFSFSIYIVSFGYFLNSMLYGKSLYKKSFLGIFISRSILILISLCIFIFKFDLSVLSFIFVLSFGVHLVFLNINLDEIEIPIKIDFKLINPGYGLLKSVLPFGLGILSVWIYDRSAFLILHKLNGFESVAIFGVAYSLYKIPQSFLGIILTPLFTELSAFYHANHFIEGRKIKSLVKWIIIISIGLIAFYLLTNRLLIKLTFGDKFIEASNMLSLISIAIPGLFLNNLTGIVLNSAYKEKLAM
ncbi:MAG: hypothetical protein FJ213_05350, partial [Ignavibacteria bacterium]|nr:hypothetical protein [Ignavibacteria bacterium]